MRTTRTNLCFALTCSSAQYLHTAFVAVRQSHYFQFSFHPSQFLQFKLVHSGQGSLAFTNLPVEELELIQAAQLTSLCVSVAVAPIGAVLTEFIRIESKRAQQCYSSC